MRPTNPSWPLWGEEPIAKKGYICIELTHSNEEFELRIKRKAKKRSHQDR